jgi:hypothetical protein
MPRPVFLLSPANLAGKRAGYLLREAAAFELAVRLRTGGAPVGEVFSFVSGLYFRGKVAYARAFGEAPGGGLVIVPGRGLVAVERLIGLEDLIAIQDVRVDPDEPRFRAPLERDAARLAADLGPEDCVVLLGSIASDKYVAILSAHLGRRLHFPIDFVGRGDMSRGGLMLRAARAGTELAYVPLEGAARRGSRPPRLPRA